MLDTDLNTRPRLHPALSLFFIIILAGFGFIAGGIIGVFAYLPFFDGSELTLFESLQNVEDHPELKPVLFLAQIGATLGGLILAPIIFLRTQRLSVTDYFRGPVVPFHMYLLAGLIVLVSFGVNSLFMEWNQGVQFPEFLKEFEQWARERETLAQAQTEALTKMENVTELLLGILVIAVLPAIGEEFVFRGIIQNEFFRATKSVHLAVWFAAILFSAIHFQFFGFIPRMILGAMFGYFYLWSGNLWVPIFAHFVNNGIQVVALYMYQHGAFTFDLEKTEEIPPTLILTSALFTGGLLYFFYRYFRTNFHSQPS